MRKCCGGFFGEHCEPCPGPVGQACFGNGLCLDGTNGTGGCQCSKGFYGTACETCLTGKYGVHCDQGMFPSFTPADNMKIRFFLSHSASVSVQSANVKMASVTRASPVTGRASVTLAGEESSAMKVTHHTVTAAHHQLQQT